MASSCSRVRVCSTMGIILCWSTGLSHPSRVVLQMSDTGFGTGTQKKGGVKVGVKEREDTKTSPKEKEKFEVEWRVLLHNDDVHTFDYVSRQLADVSFNPAHRHLEYSSLSGGVRSNVLIMEVVLLTS